MSRLVDIGKEVLEKEAHAILQVMERLDDDFDRAVNAINSGRGRVVFSGIGKSGLIAKKIASTFSSVGIPSLFLHPADSLHGDLGIVQKDDIFFIISNSGETDEVMKKMSSFCTRCRGWSEYPRDAGRRTVCPHWRRSRRSSSR